MPAAIVLPSLSISSPCLHGRSSLYTHSFPPSQASPFTTLFLRYPPGPQQRQVLSSLTIHSKWRVKAGDNRRRLNFQRWYYHSNLAADHTPPSHEAAVPLDTRINTAVFCKMGRAEVFSTSKPILAMILAQLFLAGQNILSRVTLQKGISIMAFITYRHLVAAMIVIPLACWKEREKVTTKISLRVLLWMFLNALFGIPLGVGLFYYGLRDTTATYSTVFLGIIPIVTYILCILVRFDSLSLNTKAGRLSFGGTMCCVVGALIFSIYHGKAFHLSPRHQIVHAGLNLHHQWLRGTLFLIGSCLSDAIWYLVQAKLSTLYASTYWTTALTCIMGSFQSMIVGLVLDRSFTAWRLAFDMQLLTIVYSGVLVTGVSFCLNLWTIKRQGAIFPTLFLPLCMVFVTVAEAILFGEAVTVGSVIGSVVIIFGLYLFTWGRRSKAINAATNATDAPLRISDAPVRISA